MSQGKGFGFNETWIIQRDYLGNKGQRVRIFMLPKTKAAGNP
jgi:hypothetical protein